MHDILIMMHKYDKNMHSKYQDPQQNVIPYEMISHYLICIMLLSLKCLSKHTYILPDILKFLKIKSEMKCGMFFK